MGVGVGARLVEERIEEEMRLGEKPRTMLCELSSVDVLASDSGGGLILEDVSLSVVSVVATVEVDESGTIA